MTYDAYGTTGGSKQEAAQQEAGAVKDTALSAGQDVKDTAVGEAADLKDHAADRAQDLIAHSRDQVGSRLSDGQNQLAQFVGEFAGELHGMANGQGAQGGYASEIVGTLASRGQQVADFLSTNEPSDVLDEVRRYAARRPMTFLGISLAAGIVAGRLVRGLQASQSSQGQLSSGRTAASRQLGEQAQFSGRQQSLEPGSQPTFPSEQSSYAGQVNTPLGHEEHSSMFADTPQLGAQSNEFGVESGLPHANDNLRGGQL